MDESMVRPVVVIDGRSTMRSLGLIPGSPNEPSTELDCWEESHAGINRSAVSYRYARNTSLVPESFSGMAATLLLQDLSLKNIDGQIVGYRRQYGQAVLMPLAPDEPTDTPGCFLLFSHWQDIDLAKIGLVEGAEIVWSSKGQYVTSVEGGEREMPGAVWAFIAYLPDGGKLVIAQENSDSHSVSFDWQSESKSLQITKGGMAIVVNS